MILTAFHGFCMALADSVPGVSGGTILSGAVAITAMVLLGILGASILLIAGVYLPAIQAVRSFLHMELSVLPGLFALGFFCSAVWRSACWWATYA